MKRAKQEMVGSQGRTMGRANGRNRAVTMAIALLLVLGMTLSLAACGGASSSGDGANTLVYGSGDYTAINPALYEHGEINALLFAGMTGRDAENRVTPALAETWTYDDTGTVWTFQLREGLTFHDGEPLTSEDVKFTLEAILNPDNQSEIATNYQDITDIQCPDERTVVITLSQYNAALPDYMSIGILPKHLLEGEDLATCDFNQHPVGAGPYKLVEWDRGQSITLEKFDGYYAGAPNIDTVVFKIIPDMDSRALQLESGDLDMAQISPKAAAQLADSQDVTVYHMETADYRAIAYNFGADNVFSRHPELANILSRAIDRDAIVEGVLLGEGYAAYSPLQAGPYVNEDVEHFAYDPGQVEADLQAAGWTIGATGYYEKDGEPLAFTITAMSNDSVRVDMATLCAAQLQEIHVDAKAEALPELDWAGQDCTIIGWGSPFDPDDHTYKVFTTDAGDNYTGYANSEVDQLLLAARTTALDDTRKDLYNQFQVALTKQMPYTFLAYVNAQYGVRKGITGLTPETVLGHHGVGVFYNIAEWEIQ